MRGTGTTYLHVLRTRYDMWKTVLRTWYGFGTGIIWICKLVPEHIIYTWLLADSRPRQSIGHVHEKACATITLLA
jgi:arginine/ornithine N-succinyltransferase beta subunit